MDRMFLAMAAIALPCGVIFVAIRNYLGWLRTRGNGAGVYPERTMGQAVAATLSVGLVWGLAFCVLAMIARAVVEAYLLLGC